MYYTTFENYYPSNPKIISVQIDIKVNTNFQIFITVLMTENTFITVN